MSEVKQGAQAAIEVFYSYATQDETYFRALQTRMKQLERQQPINGWHRGLPTGGTEPQQEIAQHLDSAQLILLLISPDYLGDDECFAQMQRAAARMKAGEADVAPIILRHVELDELPFDKTELLPTRGRAIRDRPDRDAAYEDIMLGLRSLFKQRKRVLPRSGAASGPRYRLKQTSPPWFKLSSAKM